MELGKTTLRHVLRLTDEKPAPESRRKYCKACGSLIPHEADYCPNCGAAQEPQGVTPAAKPKGRVAKAIATRMRSVRLTLFLVSLAVFVAAFLLGSKASLTRQEAQAIVNELMDTYGANPSVTLILRNNLTLCLLFFIPVFGTAFMAFVGYSTGMVLSAVALVSPNPTDSLILALVTLSLPWTWMEFVSYNIASSEGVMIILALIGRNIRKEAKRLLMLLAVSVALLVLGAFVEAFAIRSAMASQ